MAVTYGVPSPHLTINAACTEVEASHDYSTDGIADIQVDTTTADTQIASVGPAFAGTASITNYIRIQALSGSRHAGKYSTGKQRLAPTAGGHCFTVTEDFVHFKWLQIEQASATSSAECVRSGGNLSLLFEKCIFVTNNTADQDGIHMSAGSTNTISVFDCVFTLGGSSARAGILMQDFAGSTHTLNAEHCTFDGGGSTDGDGSGIGADEETGSTVIANVDNCISFNSGVGASSYNTIGTGAAAWSGQGNAGEDTTCITLMGATNNLDSQTVSVTDEAATEILVTSLTGGSEDYQLIEGVSATNTCVDNAIDPGSRDTRIDITEDCAGNARPGTFTSRDSGAFEVVASAALVNTRISAMHFLKMYQPTAIGT